MSTFWVHGSGSESSRTENPKIPTGSVPSHTSQIDISLEFQFPNAWKWVSISFHFIFIADLSETTTYNGTEDVK